MVTNLAELQQAIDFSTDLTKVKTDAAIIRDFLAYLKGQEKAARGLLEGVYACCPHKNQTTYSDPRDWGGTCHDCGKTW